MNCLAQASSKSRRASAKQAKEASWKMETWISNKSPRGWLDDIFLHVRMVTSKLYSWGELRFLSQTFAKSLCFERSSVM